KLYTNYFFFSSRRRHTIFSRDRSSDVCSSDLKRERYSIHFINSAVFVCGAAVMVYEITGSRIVSPFIGTSTYVWTSLIGVILGRSEESRVGKEWKLKWYVMLQKTKCEDERSEV